ncbi:MAG TPA: amidohydrolase family protein [Candidatus Bathyarchaeia archaeon]|nr:amidohydrolase family protein [Candidatus Bathyarchaeia archaeon]
MTEPFELLLLAAKLPDGRLADVGMRHGSIAEIGALAGRDARRVVDCGGLVLTPGLVDAHIHLDKALLSERAPSVEGTVAEALRVSAAAKRSFTVEDIRSRARRVLDAAVRAGTTAMRSHVEIDPIVELRGLEALLALKSEYAPAIDLQLCAFAQEGILQSPGTEALLARALEGGADLIGGCPYNDTDAHAQIDIVFRLAREYDVDVDFHIDFFDEPEHLDVLYVAEQTVRFGWQGRVAAGHVSELAALEPERFDQVAAILKDAGVGVIVLPATDLYLMGRKDARNPRRGLAPARRLLAAGVTVAAATNNVLNAFTPMGTGDLALMGYLVTAAAHMGAERDVADVLAMLTEHPARLLRLPDYGLRVGGRADLVLWDTERPGEVVTTMAPRRLVVKAGRLSIQHERTCTELWRTAG